MRAKARSLSAPQERKLKVALNRIMRAGFIRIGFSLAEFFLSQREDKCVVNWENWRNKFNN